jgi:hypothetical protein
MIFRIDIDAAGDESALSDRGSDGVEALAAPFPTCPDAVSAPAEPPADFPDGSVAATTPIPGAADAIERATAHIGRRVHIK